jgi:hypothetical protein
MKTGASFVRGKVMLQGASPKRTMLLGSTAGFGTVLAGKHEGAAMAPPRASAGAPARTRPEPERAPRRPVAPKATVGDPLDPVARQAAQLAPPLSSTITAGTAGAGEVADVPAAMARTSLEQLLPALVRRVAWSGDGRKGTVRLELGAGGMAGAEVVVESDQGRVRVQLRAPAGVDAEAWRRRVEGRLTARGLQVDGVVAE